MDTRLRMLLAMWSTEGINIYLGNIAKKGKTLSNRTY